MTATSRPRWRVGLALAAVIVLGGCRSDDTSPATTPPATDGPSSAAPSSASPSISTSPSPSKRPPRIKHVVVVSLDGAGTNVIAAVGLERLPTLESLLSGGASTLNGRTEVEQTVTLPNHTGMLTGRPVDPAVGGHGVTVNSKTTSTVQDLAGEDVESVFDVVHDAGGSTALFATEEKFALFERSWPDAIDRYTAVQDDDEAVMSAAVADLVSERRELTFIHLGILDEVGHRAGWESAEQQAAAVQADTLLGELVSAIVGHRRLARTTAVVVTADHGGVGRLHEDTGDPRDFTVPFLIQGPGIAAGADLYELNPDLADPGNTQPSYGDGGGPVRNGFVANVVTQLLRLPPVTGSVFDTDGLVLTPP